MRLNYRRSPFLVGMCVVVLLMSSTPSGYAEGDWEITPQSEQALELGLEWLARKFVAHNYDMKHLQRLILTSEAYSRASLHPQPDTLAAKDPTSTGYARESPSESTS